MVHKYEPSSPSLLSPGGYDDDNRSLKSLSDQDSDSEDDEILRASRSTIELAQHDRTVLDEEEEREKLLVQSADGFRRIFTPGSGSVRIGKRERENQRKSGKKRDSRRHGKTKTPYRQGDLMFEVEAGYRDSESSDSNTLQEIREKEPLGEWNSRQVNTHIFRFVSPTDKARKLTLIRASVQENQVCMLDITFFSHRHTLPYPLAWCVSGFGSISIFVTSTYNPFQRNCPLWPNDDPSFTRWIPCRFP